MSLASLLKKDWMAQIATLTVATHATHGHKSLPTVAKIASVTVANPKETKNGREAANDPANPDPVNTEVVNSPVNRISPKWKDLDQAYMAHHIGCPTCIAAGKGYGLRCGTGAALWAAYDAVDMPVHKTAVSSLQPAKSCIHPSLLTVASNAEIETMAARLALFESRGLAANEAERLADKLLVRDREGDRRGACAECSRFVGTGPGRWRCGDRAPVMSNELAGAFLGAAFVHLNLHRCFSLEKAR